LHSSTPLLIGITPSQLTSKTALSLDIYHLFCIYLSSTKAVCAAIIIYLKLKIMADSVIDKPIKKGLTFIGGVAVMIAPVLVALYVKDYFDKKFGRV